MNLTIINKPHWTLFENGSSHYSFKTPAEIRIENSCECFKKYIYIILEHACITVIGIYCGVFFNVLRLILYLLWMYFRI